jgi:glutamyl-tRNA reductase
MARYLKEMNPEAAEIVDKVTKSMMQKIVKYPAVQLKAACKRGDADNLIEALHEIFNLEQIKENL